ncbi:serine/threonine protein phosphatase 1 [Hoeflea marina]|uniref:Serine/threonine protein phosphatase 1 n=1 Tax=Hoeflea marina TaxID=274592 RepID=A0A317PT62_9HYPH|nr:metallophosphoesterase [Hoeflea marina]PWW04349.1 serine/threonine protein phosphatase 1 [Hoeflea marina]
MKTFVISDLHGRFDLLEAALAAIHRAASSGSVVFTGDYVDRGPESRQIVERLMRGPDLNGWSWTCLKGNHEAMMVGGLRGQASMEPWLANGGLETRASYPGGVPEAHLDWLAALPLLHRDRHRIYVHAGVDDTLPISTQPESTLLWMRTDRDYIHPEGYVVHGHMPIPDGPLILAGRADLDTLAVRTGRLVIGVFDDAIPGPPVDLMTVQGPPLRS